MADGDVSRDEAKTSTESISRHMSAKVDPLPAAMRWRAVLAMGGIATAVAIAGIVSTYEWLRPRQRTIAENSGLRAIEARLTADLAQPSGAVASLLLGQSKRAVAEFAALTETSPSAAAWSDLAAARYTLASESPEAIADALVAADASLELDPKYPEALFNRALILERLGTRELAVTAWRHYLEVDGASRWASEAQTHLRMLSGPRDAFESVLNREYDRIAADPATLEKFAPFEQEARSWGETEILGRWAEAERSGDRAAAERHLAVARAFGYLAQRRGDALLAEAVTVIDRSNGEARAALAAAHLDFRAAQHTFMNMQPANAEPLFARAAEGFARTQSPAALLARYFRANTIYEQNRVAEAAAALERLLREVPARFRSCRAQIQWEIALCRAAQGRYGEAIAAASDGRDTFAALGERRHAATLGLMLAWISELIGDAPAAWTLRTATLAQVGDSNSTILLATLGSIGQTAILRQDWRAAASFLTLQLEAARDAKNDPFAADACLRRALSRGELGLQAAARADLDEARRIIGAVTDAGIRTQLDGRALWVDGVLASSPPEKIAALSRAIDFHQTQTRRMTLPSILYDRARAHRAAGDIASATADLEAAMSELEAHRESLPMGNARWGIFHAAEELFEEAIDIALTTRSVETAFRYSERARARTLLDALRGSNDVNPRDLPENTAIVEYATSPTRLVVFVVDRSGIRVAWRPIDRRRLRSDVDRFQAAIQKEDTAAMREAGRVLYAALIQPVAAWIPEETKLVIVPDSTTARISYGALITPENRYLAQRNPTVIAGSAAVFTRAPELKPAAVPTTSALVVVNDRPTGRERLMGAVQEAAAIRALYPDTILLRGREATPDAFAARAAEATLIHFAGHALTSDVRAEDTFLVLQNGAGGEERVDVEKIAEMQLERSPVVVLAACSTARGRVSPLEGTMSAAHAFLAGGAHSVVATLWPIDDQESGEFFVRIHQLLARGAEPADAVRTAQIEWSRQTRSPAVWASVQVIGH